MSDSKAWIPRLKLVGGALCLDFANTTGWRIDPQGQEALRDYEDVVEWSAHAGAVDAKEARRLLKASQDEPRRARDVHRRAVALREAIYRIFSARAAGGRPAPADVHLLNSHIEEAYRHLRLAPAANGFAWEWQSVDSALELPLWRVTRSAADLLVSDHLARVRECSGHRCDWLFLDLSKNQSRRWCVMAECGNREKARRNYARRKETKAPARAASKRKA